MSFSAPRILNPGTSCPDPNPPSRAGQAEGGGTWRPQRQTGRSGALGLLSITLAIALGPAPVLAEVPGVARQRELVRLVRQDCGSCHGMTLNGGLGPPLTPGALSGKPGDSLVATIMNGRPGTPMPPWSRFLAEGEAHWIVDQLMRGFPAE